MQSQVLRVNATDRRITYTGNWQAGFYSMSAPSSDLQFFIMFRGTSIKMYRRTFLITTGTMLLWLDGEPVNILLDSATSNVSVTPIYGADNMQDGDHQLMGNVSQLTNGSFTMDHLEIENSSGGGFDLLSAGLTAQNVPTQAATVDDTSPEIIYHNESVWTHFSGRVGEYEGSLSCTSTIGGSLSYSFNGVAIWYYSTFCNYCGFFTVSIDGSTPQRLNATSSLNLDQRMIWSNASLGPGRHTMTLTHDDADPLMTLCLDFFRVLAGEGTSSFLSSFSTTSPKALPTDAQPAPPTNQSQVNRIPLVVGLVLGILALVILVLGSFCYRYRRRRRTLSSLDPHTVFPYTARPMRQAGQQSTLPQGGKQPPRPARPSSVPVVAGDLAMSLRVSGLGPPPSYETPTYDWRVSAAQ